MKHAMLFLLLILAGCAAAPSRNECAVNLDREQYRPAFEWHLHQLHPNEPADHWSHHLERSPLSGNYIDLHIADQWRGYYGAVIAGACGGGE